MFFNLSQQVTAMQARGPWENGHGSLLCLDACRFLHCLNSALSVQVLRNGGYLLLSQQCGRIHKLGILY